MRSIICLLLFLNLAFHLHSNQQVLSKNIVLTVPRSGTNLTLWTLCKLTEKNFIHLTQKKKYPLPLLAYYVHEPRLIYGFKNIIINPRLLFIIRSPKELFFRWLVNKSDYPFGIQHERMGCTKYSADLTQAVDAFFETYLSYLKAYEDWDSKKKIVHYEDIIGAHGKAVLKDLLGFFNESPNCIRKLKGDIQSYSLGIYKVYQNNIQSDGGGNSVQEGKALARYYSSGKSLELRLYIDNYLKNRVSSFFWENHFKRYAEK